MSVNRWVGVGNDSPTSSHDHLPLAGTASADRACWSTVKELLPSIGRYTRESSSEVSRRTCEKERGREEGRTSSLLISKMPPRSEEFFFYEDPSVMTYDASIQGILFYSDLQKFM